MPAPTGRPIGYVAADVEGMDPARLCAVLAGIGYEAIDWTMEQFDPLVDDAVALCRLVEIAGAAGLVVPQLMVHQDYVTRDAGAWEARVARTERAIDAAAAAGVPSVGVVTGPNRWVDGHDPDVPDDVGWSLAASALERVVAHARGTEVRVSLEPCWGTLVFDRSTAARMLALLDTDEVGLTIDPSHFVMTGDDVPAMVREWRERIAHVHLKDAFGRPGFDGEDFCFLLPGEGRADWPGLFDALDDIGYGGGMSVEFESFSLRDNVFGGDVAPGARMAHELVRGLLRAQPEGR